MARKTREEKLQETIDHLENVVESLDHLPHIKNIYFNAAGDYFLFCREYRGKKFASLGIAGVFIDGGDIEPPKDEIACIDEDGKVKAKYIAPTTDVHRLEIVKTRTMKESKGYFNGLLSKAKAELEDLYEPRVPKKALKAEIAVKKGAKV